MCKCSNVLRERSVTLIGTIKTISIHIQRGPALRYCMSVCLTLLHSFRPLFQPPAPIPLFSLIEIHHQAKEASLTRLFYLAGRWFH